MNYIVNLYTILVKLWDRDDCFWMSKTSVDLHTSQSKEPFWVRLFNVK